MEKNKNIIKFLCVFKNKQTHKPTNKKNPDKQKKQPTATNKTTNKQKPQTNQSKTPKPRLLGDFSNTLFDFCASVKAKRANKKYDKKVFQ